MAAYVEGAAHLGCVACATPVSYLPPTHSADGNLKVWATAAAGAAVAALPVKAAPTPDAWPLAWCSNESVAFRLTGDGTVAALGGSLESMTPLSRLPARAVNRMWVGPRGPPFAVVTFSARTKSAPATCALWAFPKDAAPVTTRSMQADTARVEFNADGSHLLVELSTDTSADSY